jgi:outer membrane protein OmpA-like peptidoglycan-associated protein
MQKNHTFNTTMVLLAAFIAGCSTVPQSNAMLEQARSQYRTAQENPQTRELAPSEFKLASDSLERANQSFTQNEPASKVDHLAYLAKQRMAIAQETATRKAAELAVANAALSRDAIRLAERTNEADAAQREAANAQARNSQLEAQLKELNAKKTQRGMVITIGDVLFDTNQAQLKLEGFNSIDKLVDFLNQNSKIQALVEGFTDSIGSKAGNENLSNRRANAVRIALIERGISSSRVSANGYGEAFPVAGNESARGRKLNRRVEIVLSDESGNIAPR